MRIKARALALAAEDYFNDKVLEDTDLLYTGVSELPADFWDTHGKEMESWQQAGRTFYRVHGPLCPSWLVNEFVHLEKKDEAPFYAIVKDIQGKTALLSTLKDYTHQKNNVWGIVARNREQNFALNLLMNPEIDFVTLLGQAGTGKTLLTLAAGLMQTLEDKTYSEIIMSFNKGYSFDEIQKSVVKVRSGIITEQWEKTPKLVARVDYNSRWDVWYRFTFFVVRVYDFDSHDLLFAAGQTRDNLISTEDVVIKDTFAEVRKMLHKTVGNKK